MGASTDSELDFKEELSNWKTIMLAISYWFFCLNIIHPYVFVYILLLYILARVDKNIDKTACIGFSTWFFDYLQRIKTITI